MPRTINPLRTLKQTAKELRQAWTTGADVRSRLQLCGDVILYRVLSVVSLPAAERRVRLASGVTVTYRLNRGDIQSVREIWFDEGYKLPFDIAPRVIVDLGANIGMTSLWYSKRYACRNVIAVEPSAANARLLRKNLAENGVDAEVVEAAVGSQDGTAQFVSARDSNVGALGGAPGSDGVSVPVVSMPTIMRKVQSLGLDSIDLLKIDIEGGETDLLSSNIGWLDRVQAIAIEFHPDRVDYPGLVGRVAATGLQYVPGDSVFESHNDSFVRGELTAAVQGKIDEVYAGNAPEISKLRGEGLSLVQIAGVLNGRGEKTRYGQAWNDIAVSRVLASQ